MTEPIESENAEKMVTYPMFGVTSFAELDDLQQANEAAHEMGELLEHFRLIADNIMSDAEITDKAAAIRSLSDELVSRMGSEGMEEKGIFSKIKSLISPQNDDKDHTGLMVWKDKSTGQYRWFAIYSNKYRDNDYPPEIISSNSHKNFVKMANSGQAPMPELWQWHIPGTRWGIADWVDFTDNGFAVASGTVDKGCEGVAESYARDDPDSIRVSHGMPKPLIVRSINDDSVIEFHVTTEISPLPQTKEANPLTGFNVFDREVKQMSLLSEQKEYLMSHGLSPERVNQIEAGLDQLGKQAEGRESKNKGVTQLESADRFLTEEDLRALSKLLAPSDKEAEPVEVEAAEEVEDVEATTEPDYVTREELVQTLAQLVQGVQTIGETVKSLSATVEELQQEDGAKIAKAAKDTPVASLSALIAQSVIGKGAAHVDGRSTLAKDGPKQTESGEDDGLFFQEWTK